MSRTTIAVFITVFTLLAASITKADFVVGPFGFPQIVHNDGTPGVPLTGGPSFTHESYDTFVLSADSQHVFSFANDLGLITAESWSTTSGVYTGPVTQAPGSPSQFPSGFQPGFAIGEVHTRSTHAAFGGDLVYVSPFGPDLGGSTFANKPVIQLFNTNSKQLVEQIVPPTTVNSIYDFTMGPGALGAKSRAYINTEDGTFVYNETAEAGLIFDPITNSFRIDNSHFRLDSATPLLTGLSFSASFDISPVDGYLYVLDGVGSASSIKRYNTTTGALIDTFLSFAQYNYGGVAGKNLKFGADAGLYLSSSIAVPSSESRFVVSRFDPITGLHTNDYDLGNHDGGDFYLLSVPEPAVFDLILLASLFPWQRMCHRSRREIQRFTSSRV